tara:strand:- start:136 stop:720 length:585 start_codon:yes stop_codon:yes gene_type:complete
MNDFIEVYDALSSKECDIIINYFDNNPKGPGVINDNEVDSKRKISIETCGDIYQQPILLNALRRNVPKYKEKYPGIDIGFGNWNVSTGYNIQKFEDGGGYFAEHSEHVPAYPNRMLVWMVYLNDAKCGTRFKHQRRVIEPKKGRLVLWPATWTHTHCGVTPNIGDKYIATGWFELDGFREAGQVGASAIQGKRV